jgi:hypothetical protein
MTGDPPSSLPPDISARLSGAKHVQDQIRFLVGVMTVISTMIFVASYNAYLSFDHAWVFGDADRGLVATPGAHDAYAGGRSAPNVLTEHALRLWVESRNVQISLLGIRVSIDDAPVVGTLALLVVELWLLLVVRRENRTIGFLLYNTRRAASDAPGPGDRPSTDEQRWLIFQTLISNAVFTNLDYSLARFKSLNDPPPPDGSTSGAVRRAETLVARALGLLFFVLPLVVAVMMFVLDWRSYQLPSPFKLDYSAPRPDAFFTASRVTFLFCFAVLAACCSQARRYVSATENLLREYRDVMLGSPAP